MFRFILEVRVGTKSCTLLRENYSIFLSVLLLTCLWRVGARLVVNPVLPLGKEALCGQVSVLQTASQNLSERTQSPLRESSEKKVLLLLEDRDSLSSLRHLRNGFCSSHFSQPIFARWNSVVSAVLWLSPAQALETAVFLFQSPNVWSSYKFRTPTHAVCFYPPKTSVDVVRMLLLPEIHFLDSWHVNSVLP